MGPNVSRRMVAARTPQQERQFLMIRGDGNDPTD